jgi:hypothetical protein
MREGGTYRTYAHRHRCSKRLADVATEATSSFIRAIAQGYPPIYTRLAPPDLQKLVSMFDENNGVER